MRLATASQKPLMYRSVNTGSLAAWRWRRVPARRDQSTPSRSSERSDVLHRVHRAACRPETRCTRWFGSPTETAGRERRRSSLNTTDPCTRRLSGPVLAGRARRWWSASHCGRSVAEFGFDAPRRRRARRARDPRECRVQNHPGAYRAGRFLACDPQKPQCRQAVTIDSIGGKAARWARWSDCRRQRLPRRRLNHATTDR